MFFTILGDYGRLLEHLFSLDAESRVIFGTAISTNRLSDLTELNKWTPFSDYILEGFVAYSLRVRNLDPGLRLEARPSGTTEMAMLG